MSPKMPAVPAPDWKRALETGMEFTEMRRSQARAIANDLVAKGQLGRDQMAGAVDEIMEMSRRRREELGKIVQHEVQRQLSTLGLATKSDLAALERRIARVARESSKAPAAKRKSSVTKPDAAKRAKKPAAKATRKAG